MKVFLLIPYGAEVTPGNAAMTEESMQLSYGRMQKHMDAMMDECKDDEGRRIKQESSAKPPAKPDSQ